MNDLPPMIIKNFTLLTVFPVNGSYVLAVYEGKLSQFDLLIKYRQLENGKWSRIRTPKHIHWAVDILIKQHFDNHATLRFLDFLLYVWDNQIEPITSFSQRSRVLSSNFLLEEVEKEAKTYKQLAYKGEYSIKFLLLMAKLLMIQEKTNYANAYMFKTLLLQLKNHKNIFQIVSTATHH